MPWPTALAAATAPVMVAVTGFAFSAGTSLFVLRLAELSLAGGAAYLLDDPAAPVTTTTPRRVWRRRAPSLLSGGAALVAAWLATVALLTAQDSDLSTRRLLIEVVAFACLAVAASAVCVRRGDREPGNTVATGVLLLGLAAMMAEWVIGTSIFVPPHDPALRQQLCWLVAALAGCGAAAVASREPAKR